MLVTFNINSDETGKLTLVISSFAMSIASGEAGRMVVGAVRGRRVMVVGR